MKNFNLLLVSFLIFSLTGFSQWTQVGDQLPGLSLGAPRISVVDSNIVWIAGGFGYSPKVYRTVDGGISWDTLRTNDLPYFLGCIAAKDSETAFVADFGGPNWNGGNAKLYKTTNAGLDWILIDSTGGTAGFYNDIQFSKSNPQFGIAMSDPANGVGGPFIVNKTTDGGVTWIRTNPPGVPNNYGLFYTSYVINPQFYGFATWDLIDMTSYTTNDGGNTWSLGDSTVPVINWGDIVFNDDIQHGVMFGNDWPNIKVTSNGGNNWITVNTGTDIGGFSTASWVSGTDVVFICSSISPTERRIIRSDDNGITWQQQDTPPYLQLREIDNIRYGEKLVAYAVTSEGYVLKSIQNVSIVPVEMTSFSASASQGKVNLCWTTATESNNSGFEIERNKNNSYWERIGFVEGHGTTTEPQEYSYVDATSGITSNSLAYRLKQLDFDGNFEYSDIVYINNISLANFTLYQNFPNPFNPTTTLEYSLPVKCQVQLVVFNALGEEVIQLVNEVKEAGKYAIDLNANYLPSGVYLYKLQAGDFLQTKKMVLMK
jgi:photosystem II stability/assembly factor-like uncharacterized protein